MTEAGPAENTRRTRLEAPRLWFGYFATESDSGVVSNPAAAVPLPTEHVKPLPDDVLVRLLSVTPGTNFVDRRDNERRDPRLTGTT